MNNKEHSGEDDWLDKMLSKPEHYIEDDGFTNLVMKALPPAKKRRSWLEPVLVFSAALVSSAIAAFTVLPSTAAIYQSISAMIMGQSLLTAILFLAVMAAVIPVLSWYLAETNGKSLI